VLGESEPFDARTYAWDATHNKTHRSDVRTGGPLTQTAYQYDGISRMVSSLRTPGTGNAVTRDYALDEVGNRQTVTETIGSDPGTDQDYLLQGVDALVNEYTVTPFEASRDYDANGNLTVLGVDATTQNILGYDYRNLMVQRTQVVTEQPPSGPSVEEVLSQYEYDALGRRISKTVGTVATRYVYDGWRVIEEYSESGLLQGSYVYGNYLDEVLTLKRGSEEFYFHTDDLWNTVALTDEDGEVIERYDYGDYGQPEFYAPDGLTRGGSIVANPCLFTGQRYDAESGLYWCKTRYLEPTTGRYTTRDTLGIWGDPANLGNGYTYAANNPWSMLDPFGMCGDKKPDDDDPASAWSNFYDLTVGDPLGYLEDSLDAALGYFVDAPVELLMALCEATSPQAQWEQMLAIANLGYNFATNPEETAQCAWDSFTNGVSDYYNGFFDPRQAGNQVFDIAIMVVGGARAKGPGQIHHGISRRGHRALEDHPGLRGKYKARDPRFTTKARDLDSHRGYEKWHRELDAEVEEWLEQNPEATKEQFEKWLKERYDKPDLKDKFPKGF
jgi:RHS repeat-associated protein